MTENHWKKPKEIEGELQWKHGLSWRDIYFQVTGNTIYLYSKSTRGGNRILHSICLTQVDEISEIGTTFSKSCFKIILKMGAIEQFKCPAPKMESLKVQQWIANLRHAQKFWTDKENLQQRKPSSERKITLERPDEESKSLDVTKHRVFFTLWNGEMIGLLVNNTSTFTNVYSRLFSFACESKSCSVCKIRHQSCDLWAVDTTGTARRVGKDEILTDLDKEGNCLFVMEHHQKLLVVFFSDFSYETLPVPSGITAKQVLKLDQIASKLNELSCFDPGLFLRRENGKEVQFCMNDNPFSYQEYGKIVARSKRIRLNSLKKSDYEVIADIRWKEFEKHIKRKKTSEAVNEVLANTIRKSSRMDEELCFVDDHFSRNDEEPHSRGWKRTTTEPHGMQARRIYETTRVQGNGRPSQSSTKRFGDGNFNGDHLKTCGDKLLVSTCPELPDYDLISLTKDDQTSTKSSDDNCAINSSDVINKTVEVVTENSQDFKRNDGGTVREESLDYDYVKNNNDERNCLDCNCTQDNTNQTWYDGVCSKNDNDIIVSASDDKLIVINMPTPHDNCDTSNNNVTNTFDTSGNEDDMTPKLANDHLVESGNVDMDATSNDEPNSDKTSVSCPSNSAPRYSDNNPASNLSPNFISAPYANPIPEHNTNTNPDPISEIKTGPITDHNTSPDSIITNHNTNLDPISDHTTNPAPLSDHNTNPDPISDHTTNLDPLSDHNTDLGPIPDHTTNADPIFGHTTNPDPLPDHKTRPAPISDNNPDSIPEHKTKPEPIPSPITNSDPISDLNQTALPKPPEKDLIRSQSDGIVVRKQRCEDITLSQPPVNRTRMRRSLSDLNVRYSFTSNETRDSAAKSRDTRAMSEPHLLGKDDVLRVDEVFPSPPTERSGSWDDEEICKQSELSTFTGPTWTFAKRVEECVRKILNVKNVTSQVEKLIREDLCKVLLELLKHGLKKNFWAVSLFSIGSNVWDICLTVSKVSSVGVEVIERVKGGSIDQKFYIFIRECIRRKILSQWFEVLSSERVQKQIMKYYEPSAVVLEPEHSKAMEHLKLYLDGLDVLKLKGLKPREPSENRTFLLSFE